MKKYETEIVDLGSDAQMFKDEDMMILFGKNAPADLIDYSYIINVNDLSGEIETGMTFSIDEETYKITAVGEVVEKNLNDLGHITLKFNGATTPELPGTLHLEDKEVPDADIGSLITIQ